MITKGLSRKKYLVRQKFCELTLNRQKHDTQCLNNWIFD